MSSARRRKKTRKRVKKKKVILSKKLFYLIPIVIFLLLIYRMFILVTFFVDSTKVDESLLSNDPGIVKSLFVFQKEGRIENVEIIIYSRGQQNILRITFPNSVYITQEGLDSFPISSLDNVGRFLQYESGKEYSVEYLGELMGIKFDNYIWLEDSSMNIQELFSDLSVLNILINPVYSHKLNGNVYSNLPILNLIKEINLTRQMLSTFAYEEIDISGCCIEDISLEGGEREIRFSARKFDMQFSRYIKDLVSREVERERVNVEVYNGTDVSGMASSYARKIRHTGCRILRYDNSPNFYEKTTIYIPEPNDYQNSLLLILDVLGDEVEIKDRRPIFMTTGDIVVILGQDIIK